MEGWEERFRKRIPELTFSLGYSFLSSVSEANLVGSRLVMFITCS